jgi:Tol biopolymer transport system component
MRARSRSEWNPIALGGFILVGLCALPPLLCAQKTSPARPPYASDRPLPEPARFDIPDTIWLDRVWHVWHNTFTPDGETMYFMVGAGPGLSHMEMVMETRFANGRWSVPQVSPFSGLYWMESPSISPDGLHFFFCRFNNTLDIMVMDKTESGWSEPRSVGAAVNDPRFTQTFPSVAANGNLYFSSSRQGDLKIFCSKWSNGEYDAPEILSDAVNSDGANLEPAIAPDESFLLFASTRAGGLGGGADLYISLRKNGAWTPARNLGPKINSSAYDGRPCISPDGKYLFFTSSRGFADRLIGKPLTYPELLARLHGPESGRTNIYQVDLEAAVSPRE